jgi:hypothetical protein
MALGPLLKGREARFTDRVPVTRFMLFEQAVADQQIHATAADLDRRDHGDAPRAALAEASCTDGGCRFISHITDCYYDIILDFRPARRMRF